MDWFRGTTVSSPLSHPEWPLFATILQPFLSQHCRRMHWVSCFYPAFPPVLASFLTAVTKSLRKSLKG